jgi:hypothetical protein
VRPTTWLLATVTVFFLFLAVAFDATDYSTVSLRVAPLNR